MRRMPACCCPLQARLNALLPGTFPLHRSLPAPDLALAHPNMTAGRNLLRFHLRPRRDAPLDARAPAVVPHVPCIAHSLLPRIKIRSFLNYLPPSMLPNKCSTGPMMRTEMYCMSEQSVPAPLPCTTTAASAARLPCAGDVPAAFDAAAEQASFRAEHAPVFEALERSMGQASTSAAPVPECITAVRFACQCHA